MMPNIEVCHTFIDRCAFYIVTWAFGPFRLAQKKCLRSQMNLKRQLVIVYEQKRATFQRYFKLHVSVRFVKT